MIEMTPGYVSSHRLDEHRAFHRKGLRWSHATYRKAVRKDGKGSREFNQKAANTLRDQGYAASVIAAVLGLAYSTVRNYLGDPCDALTEERQQLSKRREVELANRNGAPFISGLDMHFVGSAEEASEWRSNGTRGQVRALMVKGLSTVQVARQLRVSLSTVQRHRRAILRLAS